MTGKAGELATGGEAASHAEVLGRSRKPSNPQRHNTPGPTPCALQRCGMAPQRTRSFSVNPVKANPNSNEPGLSRVLRQLSPLDYELMAVMGAPGSLPPAPSSLKSTARARWSRSCLLLHRGVHPLSC